MLTTTVFKPKLTSGTLNSLDNLKPRKTYLKCHRPHLPQGKKPKHNNTVFLHWTSIVHTQNVLQIISNLELPTCCWSISETYEQQPGINFTYFLLLITEAQLLCEVKHTIYSILHLHNLLSGPSSANTYFQCMVPEAVKQTT